MHMYGVIIVQYTEGTKKQAKTDIFTCFFLKSVNLFRSTSLLCYTTNARKKQAKKQKQVKKHDNHGDHPFFS